MIKSSGSSKSMSGCAPSKYRCCGAEGKMTSSVLMSPSLLISF